MQVRLILLPIALALSLLLGYLSYNQNHFTENSTPVSARVLDSRTSLSRMKGGGISLFLDYDLNGTHYALWHTLTGFEPLPAKNATYLMRCSNWSPTNCQGEFSKPWFTIGIYSFFCLIVWGACLALWRKKVALK